MSKIRPRCENLVGKKFGKLTVLQFDHQVESKRLNYWECRCDCGNTVIVRGSFMKCGFVQSCGCGIEKVDIEREITPVQIKVGQKVRFDPFRDITGFASEMNRGKKVTGTVVYVNEPHKVFWVEYGEPKLRTSFNFADLYAKECKCVTIV